jgi:SAM-dependent methyltransferase
MAATTHHCRSCGCEDLKSVLDLGITPLADRMPSAAHADRDEPRFPLEVVFCPECSLVQILETVDPAMLFDDDYPYFSSFSKYLLEHSRKNVLELIERRKLGPQSLVIELASNDGYLLKNYVEQGVPVLGIDPVKSLCEAAEKIGVRSRAEFFGLDVAKGLVAEGFRADVIHGNNVLAHVADTNGFVAGIAALLKQDGMAVIEFPYVRDLIDHCEFDTIYHEHLCYFSVTAVDKLLRRHGLFLNDVRRLPIHGGSLRLFIEKHDAPNEAVRGLLAEERTLGLDTLDYYREFSTRVADLKTDLLALLRGLKAEGRRSPPTAPPPRAARSSTTWASGASCSTSSPTRTCTSRGASCPARRSPLSRPSRSPRASPTTCCCCPGTWRARSSPRSRRTATAAASSSSRCRPRTWPEPGAKHHP